MSGLDGPEMGMVRGTELVTKEGELEIKNYLQPLYGVHYFDKYKRVADFLPFKKKLGLRIIFDTVT